MDLFGDLTVDYSRFFEREDSDLAQSEILVDIPNFSPPMLDLEVVPERSLGNEQWEFALGESGISSKSLVIIVCWTRVELCSTGCLQTI